MDNLIDDRRRTATLPLAMSLTMLLEFGEEDAFDYSFEEFRGWAMQVRWTGCRRVCNSYSYQQGLGNAGVKVDWVCVSWAGMSDAGALGWVQVRWACKCTGLGILLPPQAGTCLPALSCRPGPGFPYPVEHIPPSLGLVLFPPWVLPFTACQRFQSLRFQSSHQVLAHSAVLRPPRLLCVRPPLCSQYYPWATTLIPTPSCLPSGWFPTGAATAPARHHRCGHCLQVRHTGLARLGVQGKGAVSHS